MPGIDRDGAEGVLADFLPVLHPLFCPERERDLAQSQGKGEMRVGVIRDQAHRPLGVELGPPIQRIADPVLLLVRSLLADVHQGYGRAPVGGGVERIAGEDRFETVGGLARVHVALGAQTHRRTDESGQEEKNCPSARLVSIQNGHPPADRTQTGRSPAHAR